MTPGTIVSLAGLVIAVVNSLLILAYYVGRLSIRVDHLEDSQRKREEFEERIWERIVAIRSGA